MSHNSTFLYLKTGINRGITENLQEFFMLSNCIQYSPKDREASAAPTGLSDCYAK